MFDNLSNQVNPITEQEVLSIFGGEDIDSKPNDKKSTDTGKKPEDKTKVKKTTSAADNTGIASKNDTLSDLSDDDDADIFSTEDDDSEEDTTKGKKKDEVIDDDDESAEDDDSEEDNDESEEDDDADDKKKKDKKKDDPEASEDEDVKDFLKVRAEFLIKKGEWVDFEGSEDYEWTEENFAQIELEQRTYQKQKMQDDILDSFGPIGKEIATFTANGGDPDKLIDIFKEQQRVENFSVDTEESQRAIVQKYEVEFLGKKPERVKKYIDSLVADKELKDVATEAKEAMEATLKMQADTLQDEQETVVKNQQARQKADIQRFVGDVTKLVNEDKNIPADEKQQLIKVLTKYDKKLPNGTPINEFYQKFAEFRKDLPNYLNLVRFVLNPDKFMKTLKTEGKNDATEKAFKLARTSNKIKKIKSTDITNGSGKSTGTKFKLL